uniref:NACHT and WD repeat domain containing 1 n=1 Tax=Seriola dumerili TaxID=41447 RepID=A0A3B4VFH5_SERDU
MSSERKALLEKAYPEVLSFCRSLGLVFEVVDLRWGIRNVTPGVHESCEIFLQEIETCKRISAGPAFIALLGNRYGHRALPRLVLQKQFEVLLSKLSKNPEGVKQLNQWFLKDSNAVPPTYVLQPITAHFPHYSDLRPEKTQLLQLLRSAATDAEAAGDITAEQRQQFYTSVTERELEHGLWKDDGELSALLFVREIPRQRVRDGPKRLAKYMDLNAEGLLDAEAQSLLTGLKSRLYASSRKILNLHCVELSKGSVDPKRKEHAQYLDSVCEQFVTQMKEENEDTSDWVGEEVAQHVAMSAELCRGLHGREGLLGKLCLAMWESTNVLHGPLVVHGAAGMGKTALLCKLAQEMRSVLEAGSVVVIRLLSARHPQRPDIDHVLRSICLQVCLACGLSPPSPLTAGTHLELLRFFRNVLTQVSQQGNSLLLILDALDQLSDQNHAHRLHWLPTDLPPNVHLVVSMDTYSEAFVNMRLKLESLGSFFEVERLSRDEGKQIVESNMRASQRALTPEQSDAVMQSFNSTGCPLHLKLILSAARRWTSFTPLTEIKLGANAQEMMSQLFLMLEKKHGKELVGGALGYLTLAREGLLEAELRDVMSLDDDVISEVYRYSLPPTPSLIRLPPLLWARLKRDLEDHLEERWTGGVAAVAVSSRYLTSERRGRSLRIMAEYFLGRWSGKLKPAALPGLSLLLSDRKVPPQPLWFAPGLANVRKLQELPYHLLHAGLWEELQREVIGKIRLIVIHDLDQCSQYMDCTETRLIRDTLVLIKPSLDFLDNHIDMSLFYTELLARLCSLASTFPSVIGQLCSQCEEWLLTCAEPILVPKCSFLQQPGGALQHTLSGLQGGVLCVDVSVEAELLVAGSDDGVVAVWSLSDQQLVHTLLGHTGAVLSVKVIDSSSHCLSLAADGSLRRWSLMNGQQLLCIQEAVPVDSAPSSVHLHLSEQRQLLCAERTLSLFNIDTDSLDKFLDLQHEDSVLSASISSDGRQLASGAADQLIRVRDDTLNSYSLDLTEKVSFFSFIDKSGWHQHRRGKTPDLTIVSLPAGSLSERLAVSAQVCCLEVAQNKRLLLCGLTSGTVLIYPLAMPQETLCIPPPESLSRVLCMAVSSQEKHMAVAYEDLVCLFEITTRDSFPTVEGPLERFPLSLLHAPLSSMALLSDRRLLYGTSCGEVKLHDFSSGGSSSLEPHRTRVTCVTASNWGSHAMVGSEDTVQRLWALNPLGFFFEGVLSAAFSDSDQFVFTGSQDRTVKVWDVATGNLLYVQFVYSPVVRMVTYRNGFVALTQQGSIIREVFRCPDHISPDYNPLRNVKAQYRVTSREKNRDGQQTSVSDLQDFNPAQFNLNLMSMLRAKPSSACLIL